MNPRGSRLWDPNKFASFSRWPDAKWMEPGQADEVSEMIVLTDELGLSEMD